MATAEEQIPLKHLPLDALERLIARRAADAQAAPPTEPAPQSAEPAAPVDALLASVGLRAQPAPAVDLEPLRGELARRLGEGREMARQRSALYRSHRSVGLLEYRGTPTRRGLEEFIAAAGARLRDETGAPPLYLLVPPHLYRRRLAALYDVYGAAIRNQPLVLTTPFGPLKVAESALVERITLV
jgi:hypothetical protein